MVPLCIMILLRKAEAKIPHVYEIWKWMSENLIRPRQKLFSHRRQNPDNSFKLRREDRSEKRKDRNEKWKDRSEKRKEYDQKPKVKLTSRWRLYGDWDSSWNDPVRELSEISGKEKVIRGFQAKIVIQIS